MANPAPTGPANGAINTNTTSSASSQRLPQHTFNDINIYLWDRSELMLFHKWLYIARPAAESSNYLKNLAHGQPWEVFADANKAEVAAEITEEQEKRFRLVAQKFESLHAITNGMQEIAEALKAMQMNSMEGCGLGLQDFKT